MKWSRALYAVLILVVLIFVYGFFVLRTDSPEAVEISNVAELANKGEVESIRVDQNDLVIKLKDGSELSSTKESDIGVIETLGILGVSQDQLLKVQVRQHTAGTTAIGLNGTAVRIRQQ